MQWIDTHCHLFMHAFSDDLHQVVNDATAKGVIKAVLPNIDSTSFEPLAALYNKYPEFVLPAVGLHPTHINQHYKLELEKMKERLRGGKFFAIGEIGMDLYWDTTHEKEQAEALITQLSMAAENNLPVIIHSRNAFNPVYKILKDNFKGKVTGVFHAFSGNAIQVKQLADLGFMIGIGGVVTYKNSNLKMVLKQTGLSHVVLETDAPFLTPEPFRGRRNEPANIPLIGQHISDATGLSIEKVAEITTINAKKLFAIE